MSKIRLNRAQMRYFGDDRLDITVKSAEGWARKLAPTWGMVWGHKHGNISDEEYKEQYIHVLEIPFDELLEFAKDTRSVTFVCYCADGKFCHTHLLIDYLITQYPYSNMFKDGRYDI